MQEGPDQGRKPVCQKESLLVEIEVGARNAPRLLNLTCLSGESRPQLLLVVKAVFPRWVHTPKRLQGR